MKTMTCATATFAALVLASACNTERTGTGQATAVKQQPATSPDAQAPAATGHEGCPHAKAHGQAAGHGGCEDCPGAASGDGAGKGTGHEGCPHAKAHGQAAGHGGCEDCPGAASGDGAGKGTGHEGCPHAGKPGPADCPCKGDAATCACKGAGHGAGCDCAHCKGHGAGQACACKDHHGHGAGHGACGCGKGCVMAQLLRGALALPDLRAEQRAAIVALEKALHANEKGGAAIAAHAALARELAAQVKAGTLNRTRLQTLADRLDAAKGGQKLAAKTAALNKLHGLLDPAQRQQLVAGLKLDAAPAAGPGAHHAGRAHRFFRHFTDQLALSAEQQKQIAAKAHAAFGVKAGKEARQDKMRATHKAVAEAFKAEKFDAGAIAALKEMHALRKGRPQPLIEMVAAALPLLKPEQQAKLAEALAQKAERIAKRVPER